MTAVQYPSTLFENQIIYTGTDVDSEKIFESEEENISLIIFSFTGNETLPVEETEQLQKILSACRLKKEQIVFVNTDFQQNISLAKLRNRYRVKYVIVFGESRLWNNFIMHKYIAYCIDGIQILQSEPISKLLKSPVDKKALWEQLQLMYELG